jgi:hypothetical protein
LMNTHEVLRSLVAKTKCKPGWSFSVREEEGFQRLVITVEGSDSSRPSEKRPILVSHFFPVPEATYNEQSWKRWVFECCRGVENHELGEWFRVGAERPFQPLHGPGEIPYLVREFRPEVDGRTTQGGTVRDEYKDF